MGNLEGWGGPITQQMVDQQTALQKRILARMKAFGIAPVLQGFYGMVPTTLKNKMNVKVVDQGKWEGGFTRPDFLQTTDSAFRKIAGIYYEEMKRLYGSDIRYFVGDPFHEGGKKDGIDITSSAAAIQHLMQQYYPGSTWVIQGWQGNPTPELLKGLDKKSSLIVDLFGEMYSSWEASKGYNGTDFIICNVTNFGERSGLTGHLQRIADEVYDAKKSSYNPLIKGIGIIPEGIENNPVVYDLTLELPWRNGKLNVGNWLKGYVQYRYGSNNVALQKTWQLLLASVYNSNTQSWQGAPANILCARPAMDLKKVSCCASLEKNYNEKVFDQAVKVFLSVDDKFSKKKTYQVDKLDFLRQLLGNKADTAYQSLMDAIKQKRDIKKQGDAFIKLLQMQDQLLSGNRFFELNSWLQAAIDFGKTPVEKAIALRNAKIQISYWGTDNNPETDLHEYAYKNWNGIMSSLYLARWKKFVSDAVDGKELTNDIAYYNMEKEWAEKKDMYKPIPVSIASQSNLIKEIMALK